MNIDLNAAMGQLIWTPVLVILLGVAIISGGTVRAVCASAAIAGASVLTLLLLVLVVAS